MIITSHFFATTLLAHALSLDKIELVYAYLFGVILDIDHLISSKNRHEFLRNGGWKGKNQTNLHTIVHEPIFGFFVLLFSILINSFVPLLFWSLHIFMDSLAISSKQPLRPFRGKTYRYGLIRSPSRLEWILSSVACAAMMLAGFL